MALTVDVIEAHQKPYTNNIWEVYADITFDNSYATGGETLAITTLLAGATEFLAMTQNGGLAVLYYNASTGKLQAYNGAGADAPLAETQAADDLSGQVFRCKFDLRK